jgi:hypothetical protein
MPSGRGALSRTRRDDTWKLRKNAVAGGIDDVSTVLSDQRQNDRLVRFEVANGCFLVGTHERGLTSTESPRSE